MRTTITMVIATVILVGCSAEAKQCGASQAAVAKYEVCVASKDCALSDSDHVDWTKQFQNLKKYCGTTELL